TTSPLAKGDRGGFSFDLRDGYLGKNLPLPLFFKLIMRHIFLTGHGGPEVLIYLRDRLWPAVFGTNHCVHSNNYRARAGGFAGGVVAPDLWKTELAQPQR